MCALVCISVRFLCRKSPDHVRISYTHILKLIWATRNGIKRSISPVNNQGHLWHPALSSSESYMVSLVKLLNLTIWSSQLASHLCFWTVEKSQTIHADAGKTCKIHTNQQPPSRILFMVLKLYRRSKSQWISKLDVTHPSIINSRSFLSSGSREFAGDPPSCHWGYTPELPFRRRAN